MIRVHVSRIAPMIFAALACGLLPLSQAAAQTMYKYTGPDGKIVYSDQQPPAGVKFTTMQANTRPTGVDLRAGNSPADADAMKAERLAKETARAEAVTQVQEEYNAAVRDLEAAKEPREGERARNANGSSRLTEDYFGRLAPLEQRVESLRLKLEQAKRG